MPILPNAKKALRSSQRKAVQNDLVRAKLRSSLKKMAKQPTVENLNSAFSAVDKALKKRIIHRNKAARLKARASHLVK